MFGLKSWKRGEVVPARSTENPFEVIRREFGNLFDRFFGAWPGESDWSGWDLDAEDTGSEFVVRAEAPGFEPGEFDVQISGEVLTIHAEHKEDGKDGHQRWSRLHRTVTLPSGVDAGKIEARYVNGVLELRAPKTPEAQPRRIEVKV